MSIILILLIIILILVLISTLILIYKILQRKLPIAYSIGVIGYPNSGKTTLITSLFDELFARTISSISNIIPRGDETRNRINKDIEKLKLGKALGSTIDQDLFAYRAYLEMGNYIFKKSYKFEIGDFPGNDSKVFFEKYGDNLHETPFFKWVMEADAFIFIIDLAEFINPFNQKEYIIKMNKAITIAWQKILEYHYESKKKIKTKTLVLAFTKTDLLGLSDKIKDKNKLETQILKFGFNKENTPPRKKIDLNKYVEFEKIVEKKFSVIINFLKKESKCFDLNFTSCFAYFNEENKSVGITELLKIILPK